jgi:hypothetical protein
MFVKKLYKIILVYKKVNKIILPLIKEGDCWYKSINYLENQAGFSSASGQSAVNRTGDGNMRIPIILGLPLHLWMGIILLFLIVFQIATAKKLLPVPFRWHRIMGYVILILAMLHGAIAFGLNNSILSL